MKISYNSRRVTLRWLAKVLTLAPFLIHALNNRISYQPCYLASKPGKYRLVFYDGSFINPSVPVRAVLERERGYKGRRWRKCVRL